VIINPTDTGTCPWDVGTHASRGAFMAGKTAEIAAAKLRARIFELAEVIFPEEVQKSLARYRKEHPGVAPPSFDVTAAARRDRFELRDSVLTLKDAPDEPWLRVELGRFLRAAHFREGGEMLFAQAFYDPSTELPDWEKGIGNMSMTYAYGTQGVEVEVDEETGDVRVVKAVAVHDVGRVLNRQALEGQIYGGFVQGFGYAMTEEVKVQGGRILNPGFRDYKIPTIGEIDFPVELEFVEIPDEHGPFGAKGVGEPGLVATAPAIANAIYDAVGVRIHDLPITSEKVLAALRAKREAEKKGA